MKTLGKKITNSLQVLEDFTENYVLTTDIEGNIVSTDITTLLEGVELEVAALGITGSTPGAIAFFGSDGFLTESDDLWFDEENIGLYLNVYNAYLPDDRDFVTLLVTGPADFYGIQTEGYYGYSIVSVSNSRGTNDEGANNLAYDKLGGFSFYSYQDQSGELDDYAEMASIVSQARGTTAGDLGGDLQFWTKADGGYVTPAMIIDHVGRVGINAGQPRQLWTKVSGSTSVVDLVAHGFIAGDAITFFGLAPNPIVLNTTYYVIATDLTADSFKFSATVGGSAITMTDTPEGDYFVAKGQDLTATVQINTLSASTKGLVIKSSESQVEPLLEIQDVDGTPVSYYLPGGGLYLSSTIDYAISANGVSFFTDGIKEMYVMDGTYAINTDGGIRFSGLATGLGAPATILTNYELYVDTATGIVYCN